MDIVFFPVYECVSDNYSCVLHVCVCDSKFQNPLIRQRTFSWLCDYLCYSFQNLLKCCIWSIILKECSNCVSLSVITGQNLIRINKGMTKLRKLYSEMHCVHYIWCILIIIFFLFTLYKTAECNTGQTLCVFHIG